MNVPAEMPLHRRGYDPDDERLFKGDGFLCLAEAQDDLQWLLNRGYGKSGALDLVGRHYQLAARQAMALQRGTDPDMLVQNRRNKLEPENLLTGQTVLIDGLNLVITLEVALTGSPVILCRDGVFRDLAGLRGTYRLIPQTKTAIDMILAQLDSLAVEKAIFYLDAPVSNSGRLKSLVRERSQLFRTPVEIELVHNADANLYEQPHVISGDSIVLNRCTSWFNLLGNILRTQVEDAWLVDLSGD